MLFVSLVLSFSKFIHIRTFFPFLLALSIFLVGAAEEVFEIIAGLFIPVGCATEGQYKGFQPKTWLKTYRANIFILAKMKTYGVDMSHLGDVCTTLKKTQKYKPYELT